MRHLQPFNCSHRINSVKHGPIVFLAGSIEMDTADHWQKRLVEKFMDKDVTFLNPRRDNWDATIVQSPEDNEFRDQVNWELNGLLSSDLVIFYIDPDTKSPITLLELGIVANGPRKQDVIVCCPDGFWRKGNIEMICDRFNIRLISSFNRLAVNLATYIEHFNNK